MKNLIVIIALAAFVLSSCSGSKNALVMKRKYTKGYFVDAKTKKHGTKKANTVVLEEKAEVAKVKPISIELINESTASTEELNLSASSLSKPEAFVVKATTKKSIEVEKEYKSKVIAKTLFNVFEKNTITTSDNLKQKKSSSTKGSDADLSLIIMVILCLFPFINLIPVFIKDGKNFTLNFWVTLILDCIFFLPGIIFALLVVLDVVNLA